MALCRQMDYAVDVVLSDKFKHPVKVADVSFDESVVWLVFDISKIGEIAGISELVNIYYMVVRVFVDKKSYNMRADKTGTACYYDITLHLL